MKLPERLIVTYRLTNSREIVERRCMKMETIIEFGGADDAPVTWLEFVEHDGPVKAGSRVRFDRIEALHVTPILGAE